MTLDSPLYFQASVSPLAEFGALQASESHTGLSQDKQPPLNFFMKHRRPPVSTDHPADSEKPSTSATDSDGSKRATNSKLLLLTAQLPAGDNSDTRGLSRSQQMFRRYTNIDPRSVKISSNGLEFFTFMSMRDKHQWATHNMNSRKFVQATEFYNKELERVSAEKGIQDQMIQKSPRAIMDMLTEMETKIVQRIATNNFKCKF